MTSSPNLSRNILLSVLDFQGENSENTNPRGARTSRDSPKSASSGKRKFFNKLGIPENTKNKTGNIR